MVAHVLESLEVLACVVDLLITPSSSVGVAKCLQITIYNYRSHAIMKEAASERATRMMPGEQRRTCKPGTGVTERFQHFRNAWAQPRKESLEPTAIWALIPEDGCRWGFFAR